MHPYKMSLLVGVLDNEEFNAGLLDHLLNRNHARKATEWLQAYPADWNKKLSEMLGINLIKSGSSDIPMHSIIEENTRVNFRFNKSRYLAFRRNMSNCAYTIVHTDKEHFESMPGNVVPKFFWSDATEFCRHGIGFTLLVKGKPASTAYSAFLRDKQLELGIETCEEFRGKGFALHTCSSLIDYCLENDYEPVWSCRLENTGSYKLAQKLGFEPSFTLPYYRLPV
jgi:hypothetical protein